MALEAAMQLLNLWHLPFGEKLCHPCRIWIAELPKASIHGMGGTFHLCVRLLFKKRRKQSMLLQSNAFGVILITVIALLKQLQKCLKWSLIWTARKIVQNLGNEAKETNIVKCLTCFSDFTINSCYSLASLFCVRFKSVLNISFHAKSVTALKRKNSLSMLAELSDFYMNNFGADWNPCSVSLWLSLWWSHCLWASFKISVGLF